MTEEQGATRHAPPLTPGPLDPGSTATSPGAGSGGVAGPDTAVASGRPPSWVRAGLISVLVLLAGAALGTAGFRMERAFSLRPPAVAETADGWRVTGRAGRQFSGLTLNGSRLLWQNGPSIEYLDLVSGKLRLLGPGPGMRATWAPAVGERYAIWFEAERTGSLAARAIAYDSQSGRRWRVAVVGAVYSYPALSGETAVWCAATKIGKPRVGGVRITTASPLDVAPELGTPVVSSGLVVWARGPSGPFSARELSGGLPWPIAAGDQGGELTGFALADRTLVWGRSAPDGRSGTIVATSVDDGEALTVATGVAGLIGPAYDGRTVLWAERDDDAAAYRIVGRRPGGPAFTVATVAGPVTEVAVSGGTAAWLAASQGTSWVETKQLPR